MRCRGSGFKKIKNDYRTAVNYTEDLEPVFYSSNSYFTVTLYNLNYRIAVKKPLIGDEKPLIDSEKPLIGDEKPLIEMLNSLDMTERTKKNIFILYNAFGNDIVFGRTDIYKACNIKISAAGEIIKKMKESNIIEPVTGFGKGKYKFSEFKNPQI